MTDYTEVNCRRDGTDDGKEVVFLPRRAVPVMIPTSWVSFRNRNIPPRFRNRKINFPLVLRMPTELAKSCGVIE